ncbi:MAG TPA: hypothetical protein VK083_21585 [Nocardia sp.]|uniref:hypothetical protein n=1 Tax=Nocardia TaxID=1817 RepID=UPI002455AD07|nr:MULTISPECIES: hypothetical protein [Nocardia]HLS79381.1 hypothetical protein [Nocardia sp.]
MIPAQFDDRSGDPGELPAPAGDSDTHRVALLRDPRLRWLLRAAAELSEESVELLVAVADRLRVVERRADGATAELY